MLQTKREKLEPWLWHPSSALTRGCLGDGEEEAVGGPAQDEERPVADRTAESPSAAPPPPPISLPLLLLLSKMSPAVTTHGGDDPRLRETYTHTLGKCVKAPLTWAILTDRILNSTHDSISHTGVS